MNKEYYCQLRKRTGLTQKQFAKLINRSLAAIQAMEYGTLNPSVALLAKMEAVAHTGRDNKTLRKLIAQKVKNYKRSLYKEFGINL